MTEYNIRILSISVIEHEKKKNLTFVLNQLCMSYVEITYLNATIQPINSIPTLWTFHQFYYENKCKSENTGYEQNFYLSFYLP